MSEFRDWRLASGYTYDARQEQAWLAATRQEQERCLAACVAVHRHWSGGAAEYRLPEVNDKLCGIAECVEAIRNLGAE